MVGGCRRVRSLKVRVFSSLGVVFAPYPLTTTILLITNTYSQYLTMPSFIKIEARKAQREADCIWLQQEEEANLREQERLEKEEEECLVKEAELERLEEIKRRRERSFSAKRHRRRPRQGPRPRRPVAKMVARLARPFIFGGRGSWRWVRWTC